MFAAQGISQATGFESTLAPSSHQPSCSRVIEMRIESMKSHDGWPVIFIVFPQLHHPHLLAHLIHESEYLILATFKPQPLPACLRLPCVFALCARAQGHQINGCVCDSSRVHFADLSSSQVWFARRHMSESREKESGRSRGQEEVGFVWHEASEKRRDREPEFSAFVGGLG